MTELTTKDAAERLDVSEQSITRYIRKGQLKAHKNRLHKGQGGQWLIYEVDLEEFKNGVYKRI